MSRSHAAVIVLGLLVSLPLRAEQRYRTFTSTDVRFEYPDDWNQLTFAPPTIAAFSKDPETLFTLTRDVVDFPQEFNEVFAANETNLVRESSPGATGFTAKAVMHPALGRILQVDLRKPGPQQGRNARLSQVRHLSIPVSRYVYRVVCVARADRFDREYAAIFDHMIAKLVITPPAIKGTP